MTKLEQLIYKTYSRNEECPTETVEDLYEDLFDEGKPEELRNAFHELIKFLHVINREWK